MKILADMPISPKTVIYLADIGYQTIRLDKLEMQRADDEEIINYAYKNGMVVLTMDLDFGATLAHLGWGKPSVIIFRLGNPDVHQVNTLLSKILPEIEADLERGAMAVVEEDRVRIRNLPIG